MTAMMPNHRCPLAVLALVLFLTTMTPRARAQNPAAPSVSPAPPTSPAAPTSVPALDLNDPRRWSEPAFGISLLPPPPEQAQIIDHPADGALLHIVGREGYLIIASLRETKTDVERDRAVADVVTQTLSIYPAKPMGQAHLLRAAERDVAVIYYRVDPSAGAGEKSAAPKADPWLLGQTIVFLYPQQLLVFEIRATTTALEKVNLVVEALLDSLAVMPPEELAALRQAQLQRGDDWLKTVTADQLRAAAPPERWLRILEGDIDVGYLRYRCTEDEAVTRKGLRLEMQSRVVQGLMATDFLANFFMADDGSTEIWSIRTTVRPADASAPAPGSLSQAEGLIPGSPPGSAGSTPGSTAPSQGLIAPARAAAETGLRSGPEFTVTLDTPSSVHTNQWDTPPTAYLPLVTQQIMGPLLPRQQEATFGFYSYFPNQSQIAYRTERVVPSPTRDGSYQVHTRPAPDQPVTVTHYDSRGRLLRVVMPGNRVLLPSTLQQIESLWRVR
jgi:hypothetical protein